jgi:hypothetical protein
MHDFHLKILGQTYVRDRREREEEDRDRRERTRDRSIDILLNTKYE